jgi:hypothetical protein
MIKQLTKKVEIIIKFRKNIKMVIVVIYRVKQVKVNKKKIHYFYKDNLKTFTALIPVNNNNDNNSDIDNRIHWV